MSNDISPLPHNIEAEQAVLGAMLIDNSTINKILDILVPEDFYRDAHKKIFAGMIELEREKTPIDLLTLFNYLKSHGSLLDEVGGSSYLTYLTELVPATENVLYYAELVREKSKERNLCRDAEQVSYKLKNQDITIDEAREMLSSTLDEIPKLPAHNQIEFIDSNELIDDEKASVEWYLDEYIPKSALILITAPPGVFKTWLALYIGKCLAMGERCLQKQTERAVVYYIDKENPKGLIIDRLKKIGTDENLKFAGQWSQTEAPNIDKDISAYKELAQYNTLLFFDSLIRFHTGDENSSTEMSKVISSLRSLTRNGTSVVLIHHKGKSEHNYRGSSDILAGVDICYTLSKEGELLKFSCDTKNRFGQPFSKFLKINETKGHFEFEVVESPNQLQTNEECEKVRDTINEITLNGDEPIQSKIVKAANRQHGLSQSRVRDLLKKGEGEYWQKVDGLARNKKFYEVLDNQPEADTSKDETERESSVFQFADTIPPKKLKNWQTEKDPWDEIDT